MKKTVIYFLLLFTLTLGLCACAKNSDDIITDDSSQSIISDERNGNTENNEENKIKKVRKRTPRNCLQKRPKLPKALAPSRNTQ